MTELLQLAFKVMHNYMSLAILSLLTGKASRSLVLLEISTTMQPALLGNLRLWTHTTGGVAVPVMLGVCLCHYSVSVPWMIQSVLLKLSLGMNAEQIQILFWLQHNMGDTWHFLKD
uniref:Uncharacterized protein n=1 Tax=Rhizophora mucronata TaxID=61149 RepID=A0A2P2IUV8_RHIMU